MAVLDFRGGGFHGVRPRQVRDLAFGANDPGYMSADDAAAGQSGLSVRLGRALHYLGALVSVGLILGLVAWGYQLVVRDVSGVPVIRAAEGPARTAPEEAGGQVIEHAGLSVNAVAAGDTSTRVMEVAIAPDPVGLTEADQTMGDLGAAQPLETITDVIDDTVEVTTMTVPVLPTSDETEALAAADAPAIVAPRPRRRPAGIAARRVAASESLPQAVVTTETVPITASAEPTPPAPAASVSAGAPLAQIGAFDSEAIAISEWQRVSGRNAALFAGKARVIEKTSRNGRTFWRLRVAGFDTTRAARSFCGSLKSAGTDCIATSAN